MREGRCHRQMRATCTRTFSTEPGTCNITGRPPPLPLFPKEGDEHTLQAGLLAYQAAQAHAAIAAERRALPTQTGSEHGFGVRAWFHSCGYSSRFSQRRMQSRWLYEIPFSLPQTSGKPATRPCTRRRSSCAHIVTYEVAWESVHSFTEYGRMRNVGVVRTEHAAWRSGLVRAAAGTPACFRGRAWPYGAGGPAS